MTLKELLTAKPFIRGDLEREILYVIPNGVAGYTLFPVTEQIEGVEKLRSDAVAITFDGYLGLQRGTHVWQNRELVALVDAPKVAAAKSLLVDANQRRSEIVSAQDWLREADYVGIKIAHALLVGTPEDLQQLRDKYGSILEEAQNKRDIVNANEQWLAENAEAIGKARALLATEESS